MDVHVDVDADACMYDVRQVRAVMRMPACMMCVKCVQCMCMCDGVVCPLPCCPCPCVAVASSSSPAMIVQRGLLTGIMDPAHKQSLNEPIKSLAVAMAQAKVSTARRSSTHERTGVETRGGGSGRSEMDHVTMYAAMFVYVGRCYRSATRWTAAIT